MKQQDTETKLLGSKIRNLEFKIEQVISKKNAAMSCNNQLKETIDSLRKEELNYITICQNLQEEIKRSNENTQRIIQEIDQRVQQTIDTEDQVMLLKRKNDQEKQNYFEQFEQVKQKVIEEKR